jgi:hypothetical protein
LFCLHLFTLFPPFLLVRSRATTVMFKNRYSFQVMLLLHTLFLLSICYFDLTYLYINKQMIKNCFTKQLLQIRFSVLLKNLDLLTKAIKKDPWPLVRQCYVREYV